MKQAVRSSVVGPTGPNDTAASRFSTAIQSPSKTGFSNGNANLMNELSTGRNSLAPSQRGDASVSGANSNPFTIPADEDIFRLQEEQKAERRAANAASAALSVLDKTTFASRQQALFTNDAIKAGFRETMRPEAQDTGVGDASLAAAAVAAVPRRVERENLKDFLAKKRETFLVQMSLDTKRAEIRKLEERARQREEALKKSEAMLEEDGLRFDAFLKENDEKVQESIKRADMEAKAKQDKVLEIKRLNAAIAGLRSEFNKQEEALEDCRRYKEFLDGVTPREWFAAQAAKLEQQRQEQLAAWRAERDAVKARKEAAAAARAKAEADYTNARTQQEAERAERALKESAIALKESLKVKEPPPPVFDDTPAIAPGGQIGAAGAAGGGGSGGVGGAPSSSVESMCFTAPQQLLQVYADLEESNLFLIQVCQESEEQLEEIRGHYRDTQDSMNAEVAGLQCQIAALETAIQAAASRVDHLKARAAEGEVAQSRLCLAGSNSSSSSSNNNNTNGNANDGSNGGSSNGAAAGAGSAEPVSLEELSKKVAQVYQRCGFDPDASLATLAMLTSIEVRLEEAITAVTALPLEQVAEAEKARERERRQAAREDKLSAARAEHELRVARALERAAAPVFKKAGKPLMFRSTPPKRKVVVESTKEDVEEAELAAFLARDLL